VEASYLNLLWAYYEVRFIISWCRCLLTYFGEALWRQFKLIVSRFIMFIALVWATSVGFVDGAGYIRGFGPKKR